METKLHTSWETKLAAIQKEIKELKAQLGKPRFFESAEQDYDLKSKIIARQNEMIEILIEEGGKLHKQLTEMKGTHK